MANERTLRNKVTDDIRLGAPLHEASMPPKHPKRIHDYLRDNQKRLELRSDIAQLKRHLNTVYLWLRVGVTMLVLVLVMQLMLWFASY